MVIHLIKSNSIFLLLALMPLFSIYHTSTSWSMTTFTQTMEWFCQMQQSQKRWFHQRQKQNLETYTSTQQKPCIYSNYLSKWAICNHPPPSKRTTQHKNQNTPKQWTCVFIRSMTEKQEVDFDIFYVALGGNSCRLLDKIPSTQYWGLYIPGPLAVPWTPVTGPIT